MALAFPPTTDPLSATDEDLVQRTIPLELGLGPAAPPACDPDLWRLHVRYQRTQDPRLLEALVDEYRAMAAALARRMHRGAEPLDDLRQVAWETLVRCLQSFDCRQNTPFVGYATPAILGALKRHYRDHGWTLRAPRRAHELASARRDAEENLTAQLGRSPSLGELSSAIGVEPAEVEAVDIALRARSLVRLDAPLPTDKGDTVRREVGIIDNAFTHVEDHVDLAEALDVLGPRERKVLSLYFYEELTQSEIARQYGVSQMQVSRWIRSALARLRVRMEVRDERICSRESA